MDEIIDINVTQGCIQAGRKSQAQCCPIALAFRNAGITASIAAGHFTLNNKITIRNIPQPINQFICDFDRDLETKPFSFKYNPNTQEIITEAGLSVYEQFPVRG